ALAMDDVSRDADDVGLDVEIDVFDVLVAQHDVVVPRRQPRDRGHGQVRERAPLAERRQDVIVGPEARGISRGDEVDPHGLTSRAGAHGRPGSLLAGGPGTVNGHPRPANFHVAPTSTPPGPPITRRLALIVALFALTVGCLLVLFNVQIGVLWAVRGYVGGESLWSKGQKDAAHHLVRYAATRDPAEYDRFRDAIAIPLGDRQARLELEQP